MRIWTFFWLIVVAITATFAVVNWQVLTAPTNIDFVFAQATAPLGLVMLGAMVALGLLFLIYLVWLETKVLVDMGRAGRAAPPAQAVPVEELRTDLERQIAALRGETIDSMRSLSDRFEHVEQVVKSEARL